MKRDLSPDDVLPRLPQAWRSATWRPLDGGLSNRNWLLEYEDRKAVLKIDESPRQPPFNTRHQEALVQAVAADRGLANVVLHAGDQVYLTEYVEGTVWQASSFNDAENLRDLAMVLRRLHAMPPRQDTRPPSGRKGRLSNAAWVSLRRCRSRSIGVAATTIWLLRISCRHRAFVFSTGNTLATTTRYSTWQRLLSITNYMNNKSASCSMRTSMGMASAGAPGWLSSGDTTRRYCGCGPHRVPHTRLRNDYCVELSEIEPESLTRILRR